MLYARRWTLYALRQKRDALRFKWHKFIDYFSTYVLVWSRGICHVGEREELSQEAGRNTRGRNALDAERNTQEAERNTPDATGKERDAVRSTPDAMGKGIQVIGI
jgi:hypothetical protein